MKENTFRRIKVMTYCVILIGLVLFAGWLRLTFECIDDGAKADDY